MKNQLSKHCKLAAGAALLSALALGAPSSANAQDRDVVKALDHFKCYFVQSIKPGFAVFLQDQFDATLDPPFEEALIDDPVRFCNPALKKIRGEGDDEYVDESHHLTFYKFQEIPPRTIIGTVKISNQFGDQTLDIESANILAVPTGKFNVEEEEVSWPTDLHHFKCYFADGKIPRDAGKVELTDQFGTVRHKLREPHLFCNPVDKLNSSKELLSRDRRETEFHLVCYRISLEQTLVETRQIVNQFVEDRQAVIRLGHLLCVPSVKLGFRITVLD